MSEQGGWFGKLPALGDFVTRRLPDTFVGPWEEWLTRSMSAARQDFGDDYNEVLLTFPVWRFVLPARAIDHNAWCGLLLPSVDRVGRCFPLTVAHPVEAGAFDEMGLGDFAPILDAQEQAALKVLEDDNVEAFDQTIASLPALRPDLLRPDFDSLKSADADVQFEVGAPQQWFEQFGQWMLLRQVGARGLWWTDGGERGGRRYLVPASPADPRTFRALLGTPVPTTLDGAT